MGPKPLKIHKSVIERNRIRAECTELAIGKRLTDDWDLVSCGHCLKHKGSPAKNDLLTGRVAAYASGLMFVESVQLIAGKAG